MLTRSSEMIFNPTSNTGDTALGFFASGQFAVKNEKKT